jgi:hypothetical protein
LECGEIVRGIDCTEDVFDIKCWWNGNRSGSGVCLSLEDEYICNGLSGFVCDDYKMMFSSLVVIDGPCFYNGDKNGRELSENGCYSVREIKECMDIHTNDVLRMEKYICDDAKDIFGLRGCRWVAEEDDSINGKCVNSVVESCSDLKEIKNGSQCDDYNSTKGKCFFNGDVQINNTEVRCSDIIDVIKCEDILEMGLCMYAKKDTYPNLIIDYSLSSPSTIYCIWESENETCISKNSFKSVTQCKDLNTDFCERFEGCVVVGGIC